MERLDIRITYENADHFQVIAKWEGEEPTTIIRLEENGNIGALWDGVQKALLTYFRDILEVAGNTMKG